jgi:hypothetical protein
MSEENNNSSDSKAEAKKIALKDLKQQMIEMGGKSLFSSLPGSTEKEESPKEEKEDSSPDYDGLSKEELIELLKKK